MKASSNYQQKFNNKNKLQTYTISWRNGQVLESYNAQFSSIHKGNAEKNTKCVGLNLIKQIHLSKKILYY